jgi:hypothetical protein
MVSQSFVFTGENSGVLKNCNKKLQKVKTKMAAPEAIRILSIRSESVSHFAIYTHA